jgi:hypothetical protein
LKSLNHENPSEWSGGSKSYKQFSPATLSQHLEIAARILKEHGYPNCVGMTDGNMFPLGFRPETDDAPN